MNKQISILHYQKAPSNALPDIAASLFQAKPTMDEKALVAFLHRERDGLHREIDELNGTLKSRREKLRIYDERNDALGAMSNWSAESGLQIERPDGPSFRKLRKAVAEGRTAYLGANPLASAPATDFEKEVFRHAEVLVIEHNWAAAFKGANIDDAAIRLPFDLCAFEFKFSGRAVIAFAIQIETEIVFCPAVQMGGLWMLADFVLPLNYDPLDERLNCMVELVGELTDQIKAACIALDADVAQTDAVREPHSASTGGRNSQPLKPHHIVSLARRRSRVPALDDPSDGTGKRKRLHFRRGHWRHFEDHKTWIKWMLVGDPDLGFVEKEYRL